VKRKKILTREEVIERLRDSAFHDAPTLNAAVAMLSARCQTCAKFHKWQPHQREKASLDGYCDHFHSNVKRDEGCNQHEVITK
jgi:hypothetical protein